MAFQNFAKHIGLLEVKKHFPELLPFLRTIYGHNSSAWYEVVAADKSTSTASTKKQSGVGQGCVSAVWLF